MSLELVTGYSAEPHVSSADDGALNAGIFGTGRAVLDLGQKFAASITSNNTVTILDGDAVDQGRHIRMTPGDYETVTISNGSAGLYRADLICIQYEKNPETDVETASFVVVEGTPGSGYVDPEVTDGDILSGDTLDQFPLYRVKINGFSLESIEPLFTIKRSAVTDITLGNSTTPLPKTDGTVNVPLSVAASGGVRLVKIGNLVIMGLGGDSWGEVASVVVPAGYRPTGKIYCLVSYATAAWKPYIGRLLVNTDGSIGMNAYVDGTWVAQTDGYFVGSCAWLTD